MKKGDVVCCHTDSEDERLWPFVGRTGVVLATKGKHAHVMFWVCTASVRGLPHWLPTETLVVVLERD